MNASGARGSWWKLTIALLALVVAVLTVAWVVGERAHRPLAFTPAGWKAAADVSSALVRNQMADYIVEHRLFVGATEDSVLQQLGEPDSQPDGPAGRVLTWLLVPNAGGWFGPWEGVYLLVEIRDRRVVDVRKSR